MSVDPRAKRIPLFTARAVTESLCRVTIRAGSHDHSIDVEFNPRVPGDYIGKPAGYAVAVGYAIHRLTEYAKERSWL